MIVCFSPEADLVGGIVISAIGVDALRHVERRDHLVFATLPLLFGLHQLTETFVWWGLDGTVPDGVGRVATYLYLAFAFVVLPTYVPVAIRALEPAGRRRKVMDVFVVLGAAVSLLLLGTMIRGPVVAADGGHHIDYSVDLPAGGLVVAVYVAATCLSAILSGYRQIAIFGVVNLIAVAVITMLTVSGFASVWCGWAAVTSIAIALHVRYGAPHRSVAQAMA